MIQSMYPLECCVGQNDTTSFYWLCIDAAYFPLSALLQRAPSMRLEDSTRQIEDVTAAVVIALAMVAEAVGDHEASQTHVKGLRQIVRLRAGMTATKSNTEAQIKMCHVDLSWYLKTGWKPVFFDGHVSRDMRTFIAIANLLINNNNGNDNKFHPEVVLEIITSIQYRLLQLEYSFTSHPFEEAIRTDLLAFIASIFLNRPGLKSNYYEFLHGRLRVSIDALDALSVSTRPVLRDLKLWLLLIGSIATTIDIYQPWLADSVGGLVDIDGMEEDWPREVFNTAWQTYAIFKRVLIRLCFYRQSYLAVASWLNDDSSQHKRGGLATSPTERIQNFDDFHFMVFSHLKGYILTPGKPGPTWNGAFRQPASLH
ncbi:uncharacterized protein B0T15DRAFT_576249 [Chaetomium strumarium]|uniref:Transcription factor domain-containing protein n=1 Tax=Chaetomium strumarium TaxID=1170767 RepID=A0AAJ0M0X6_9PEZI|nr:hypothetical protein B0T15DRAFT_576249 [Chaetomium strumarium]